MIRLPMLFLSLGLFGLALAQPDTPLRTLTARSVYTQSLVYLADPVLLKELGVDEAGTKKLAEHRESWYPKYAEAFISNRGDEKKLREFYQEHEKALGQILKPEQMTRLREIIVQKSITGGIRFSYVDMVEVVDALKLDDKQRESLRGREAPEKVLTAAQQKTLKDLQGKVFEGQLTENRIAFQGNPGGFPGFTRRIPTGSITPVYAVTEEHIQAELKLTDDQKKQLEAAAKAYQTAVGDRPPRGGDAEKKRQEAIDAASAELKKTLTPVQEKRLGEIVRQRGVSQSGLTAYLAREAILAEFKITAEQKAKFAETTKGTADALNKVVLSGESAEKIGEKVREIGAEQEKKLLAVLNPEQQAKWKEAMGTPFQDQFVQRGGFQGPGGAAQPGGPGLPAGFMAMGGLSMGYTLVSEPEVQKILKLTPEQVGKLPGQAGGFAARVTKETLMGNLTAEQITRLEQITLQQRQQAAGPLYLFRFREVANAIALTDEQKKQVDPLFSAAVTHYLNRERLAFPADKMKEDTAALMKILTADQQTKWKALLGEIHDGKLPDPRSRVPAGFTRPTSTGTLSVWLTSVDVQKDLAMTADQVAKVKDSQAKYDVAVKDLAGLAVAERLTKTAAARIDLEESLKTVLMAKQQDRLDQLQLQLRVRDEAPLRGAILREPKVSEAMKLSAEHLARIQKAEANTRQVENLITGEVAKILGETRFGPGGGTSAHQEILKAYNEQATERMKKLLTAEQEAKYQELLGKPFEGKFPTVSPWGNFAPGGFGGRGGAPAGGLPGGGNPPQPPADR